MNVGIFIYDEAEVLDFAGPFEVFSTATRLSSSKLFNVFLVSETEEVTARGNLLIRSNYTTSNCPDIDLLIVVGGDHTEELKNIENLNWLKDKASKATMTASVCTGVFLLAESGILTNQKVTTHWEDMDALQFAYPNLSVVRDKRWVDEGEIVTSGGISAGIDMSLHLVRRFAGLKLAEATAKQMEFEWGDDT